jgi:hypothetical protein
VRAVGFFMRCGSNLKLVNFHTTDALLIDSAWKISGFLTTVRREFFSRPNLLKVESAKTS